MSTQISFESWVALYQVEKICSKCTINQVTRGEIAVEESSVTIIKGEKGIAAVGAESILKGV